MKNKNTKFYAIFLGLMLAGIGLTIHGCDQHSSVDTLIFADDSQSVVGENAQIYRTAIYNVVDAVAPDSKVEIRTFNNQHNLRALRSVYSGKPSDAEEIHGIVSKDVYPEHPPKTSARGTSLQAVLSQIQEECQTHNVRAVIVSDGGICGIKDKTSDEEEIQKSTNIVKELAKSPHFKGVIVLPVTNDKDENGKQDYRQILEQQVFKSLGDKAIVASQSEASEAIEKFRHF
jgi:hypothetical protein